MEPHSSAFFTIAEMDRQQAIREVLSDYQAELNYAAQNLAAFSKVQLGNPSAPFISHRMSQEFHEWCPVKLTLSSSVMVNSNLSVLKINRSWRIKSC